MTPHRCTHTHTPAYTMRQGQRGKPASFKEGGCVSEQVESLEAQTAPLDRVEAFMLQRRFLEHLHGAGFLSQTLSVTQGLTSGSRGTYLIGISNLHPRVWCVLLLQCTTRHFQTPPSCLCLCQWLQGGEGFQTFFLMPIFN